MPAILIPGIILNLFRQKIKTYNHKASIQSFPDAYSFATHSDCQSSDRGGNVNCNLKGTCWSPSKHGRLSVFTRQTPVVHAHCSNPMIKLFSEGWVQRTVPSVWPPNPWGVTLSQSLHGENMQLPSFKRTKG